MSAVKRMYKEYGAYTDACDTCKVEPPQLKFKCPECNKKVICPPFTAEKQIELIKLLSETIGYEELGKDLNYFTSAYDEQIENAIARIIVEYKDKLDTAKVKEILER